MKILHTDNTELIDLLAANGVELICSDNMEIIISSNGLDIEDLISNIAPAAVCDYQIEIVPITNY